MPPSAVAIIPAAGYGVRMNLKYPKQYHLLAGTPILVHTVHRFCSNRGIGRVIVVVPEDHLKLTEEMLGKYGIAGAAVTVCAGGRRRQDSVANGLALLDADDTIVLVHDGARPLITDELIDRCHQSALEHGAAIAAVPVKDTLKRCSQALTVEATVDRENLWQAQTPQAARCRLLKEAYAGIGERDVTDEASILELAGIPVTVVPGAETNIKITRPEDLILAEKIMQHEFAGQSRIGHGFDAHRLVLGRKLVLGGLEIPHGYGLEGHSDADVLTHALCDAVLGALGEGDIGRHFPDSDARFKDVYSITLLEQVIALAATRGFRLGNADLTLVCQQPKIAPFIERMRGIVAGACGVAADRVNIKATTTEGMGFAGRQEGIGCHAVVLLEATASTRPDKNL